MDAGHLELGRDALVLSTRLVPVRGVRGWLGARTQSAELNVIVQRPRVRFSTYAVIGAQVQKMTFRTTPLGLLDSLGNIALLRANYAHDFHASVGFSTMQRAAVASVRLSASSAWMSWNSAIGWPNCRRSVA